VDRAEDAMVSDKMAARAARSSTSRPKKLVRSVRPVATSKSKSLSHTRAHHRLCTGQRMEAWPLTNRGRCVWPKL
jgi:hypothetical protein